MRKNLYIIGLAVATLASAPAFASPKNDMQFLGYSQEFVNTTMTAIGQSDDTEAARNLEPVDEATSVQEQLTELAHTRAIRADLEDRSLEIKEKIDSYWHKMNPNPYEPALSDELRSEILASMREALVLNNFDIKQLELLDLPDGSHKDKFRAVIRVTRPLKTRNSYKEIQQNLAEIRQLCAQAATVEGVNYLSELTTFVAENPKNRYYYEKTILRY